ncbi:MAG: EF-Tu/IF-2/RF-3 family GTPase [Candidatus Methanomethylophilaceae archaeon]
MSNLNVAVLGAKDVAGEIGKKGTVTDITFFELKKGNDSVTLLEPSKYPEKMSSIFYTVEMAEFAILVVDKIDSFLGETIVIADCVGIPKGWIVLRNYIQPEQLKPLIAGTCMENYEFKELEPITMRDELLKLAADQNRKPGDGTSGSCPVDSHFNVKGVGTVVLGSVAEGHFRKHDKMTVLPLKREVVLKSIQKHDVDADDAVKGDHVGLALRGIESDELDRGFVLTTDREVTMTRRFTGKVEMVKYWKNPLKDGMVMHLGHWMQMVPCSVSVSGEEVTLNMESDLIYKPGDRAVLMYLEGGKLRVAGSVTL